ncbi:hypothetical protein CPT03_01390 [Pedobacter ginsengisoli]|uniref:DUF1573 domain-containing protein n=1 Tax=Pedobacter ginsengisoli TaxID=363852 RepID=A0A2D1U0U4_9SPHI|nr:DUF1573 domain-containing protein [Pedobacter ginsengisoli]ATP55209.1 hypothetical protein CPT03_01390 [Pedobacter ginsengisoli]
MKKILLLAAVALTLASCQSKTDKNVNTVSAETDSAAIASKADSAKAEAVRRVDGPVLTFETSNYYFGKIEKGEKVSYSFKFRNTGKMPLIIKEAIATCGCTVPEVPKEPIKPGQAGELNVVFNSAGKTGRQDKIVSVRSNALNSAIELHLTGEIKE